MTDYILKADAGHFNVSPFGFVKYAEEFIWSAQSIKVQESGFSPVPYYLLCHAIELALKAFLLSREKTIKEIKVVGHDLDQAIASADELGIGEITSITSDEREELKKANTYYKIKGFEYFDVTKAANGYEDLPNLDVLMNVATRLTAVLRPICLAIANS